MLARTILMKCAQSPEENGHVSSLEELEKTCSYSDILVTEKHCFENKVFSIPRGYDIFLKMEYGDYMTPPPEEMRGGHDLPLGKIINDICKDYKEYQAEFRGKAR